MLFANKLLLRRPSQRHDGGAELFGKVARAAGVEGAGQEGAQLGRPDFELSNDRDGIVAVARALLQAIVGGAKGTGRIRGLSSCFELAAFADKLNRLGQCRGTETEGARDDAGLAANVMRELKAEAGPLRSARITSKPLMVAEAVFNVLKPRTGRISCFSLPWLASMTLFRYLTGRCGVA